LKPVALMQHLVKLLSRENQMVLDPFMGSGSTGLACVTLHRKFSGFEIDKTYFNVAKKRLKNG
ncbi:MAG TPA: site-specific DNA-methyltransferase, partial [Chitinophagaceae bacterium]|nr:site-specific DNA-methyltransferase [Chitinophagaceae bacterium]